MDVWEIKPSAMAGNGVFARKPLPANFEVFREKALVLGPRADTRCPVVCVGCHQTGRLSFCSRNCGLPLCGDCVKHPECAIFSGISGIGVGARLGLVTPVRAVFLHPGEREKLKKLERHERAEHKTILQTVEKNFSKADLEIIEICCQVLDATAFETPTNGSSLRGIYPTAGMMNHSCTPNTRHCFDDAGHMVVETTRPVALGEELTTNYCCLVWGTQARCAHLSATKRFVCSCFRCKDPSEFGTHLMGLYCMKKKCGGVLLPVAAVEGMWSCRRCLTQLPGFRVAVIQKMIGGVVSGLEVGNLRVASRILCRDSLVPACSYLAIEFKINLIFLYGHCVGYAWSELRDCDLVLKKLLCVELLLLFALLRLGSSRQRGLVLIELASTMMEINRRVSNSKLTDFLGRIPNYASIDMILGEAAEILRNDAVALSLH